MPGAGPPFPALATTAIPFEWSARTPAASGSLRFCGAAPNDIQTTFTAYFSALLHTHCIACKMSAVLPSPPESSALTDTIRAPEAIPVYFPPDSSPVPGKRACHRRAVTVVVVRRRSARNEIGKRDKPVGQQKIDVRFYAGINDGDGHSRTRKRFYRQIGAAYRDAREAHISGYFGYFDGGSRPAAELLRLALEYRTRNKRENMRQPQPTRQSAHSCADVGEPDYVAVHYVQPPAIIRRR